MHEVSITSDLVRAILRELEKYNVKSVNSVTLVIGRMTSLGAEQMSFAYEVVTRGTLLEGSELIIENEEIVIRCKECSYEGPAKTLDTGSLDDHMVPILSCPECNGHVTVVEGQSCRVKCMDIEEA